jgi:hypothetical protein
VHARKPVILSHGGKHGDRAGTYLPGAPVGEAAPLMPSDALAPAPPAPARKTEATSINRYPATSDDKPAVTEAVTEDKPVEKPTTPAPKTPEKPAIEKPAEPLVPTNRTELKKLNRADLMKLAGELGVDAGPDAKTETVRELIASILGIL